ncbi:MAG: protein NLRC3-like [Herminiimonas sp.]|nr:protein NLRC3-like [Herminiimonas sp.]
MRIPPVDNPDAPYQGDPIVIKFLRTGTCETDRRSKAHLVDRLLRYRNLNTMTWMAIKDRIISCPDLDNETARNLVDWVASSPLLDILDLRFNFNHFQNGGAEPLATALGKNTVLTDLGLGNNKLGVAGAPAFSPLLKENRTLKKLRLQENNLGTAGIGNFTAGLRDNQTLKKLYLEKNNITDTGATVIAEELKENGTLTVLRLSHNNIGDEGAVEIASAVSKNTSLTELRLDDNNIGNAGAEAFVSGVRKNTTLTRVNLAGNKITAAGAWAMLEIEKSLESNAARPLKLKAGFYVHSCFSFPNSPNQPFYVPEIIDLILEQLTIIHPPTIRNLSNHVESLSPDVR